MPCPPTLSRRRVLVGAAALAVVGASASACGESAPDPNVVALTAQRDRALADADLAKAAAAVLAPQAAKPLTTVAAERTAHAQALTDELTRMTGSAPTTTTAASAATSTTATSTAPPKPPTVKDVSAALKSSADDAARVAVEQSGYRAGLLGSIAAACAAAYEVALGGGDDE